MDFTLTIPPGYEKISLPYFNEWIEALESGKYPQCIGALSDGDGFCCLGILSKIQGRLVNKELIVNGEDYNRYVDGNDSRSWEVLCETNPCYNVLGGAGIFPEICFVNINGRLYHMLAECNDKGLTFKEIATIIKALWKP